MRGWWHRNQGGVVGVLVGAVVALVALCALVVKAQGDQTDKIEAQAAKIESEGVIRRDESCRGWEQAHGTEITDLERSYEFYADPDPPPAIKELLASPVALASLAERARDAQGDQDPYGQFVPSYCDEKGVGLAEPDPVVPEPPARVARLLERLRHETRQP